MTLSPPRPALALHISGVVQGVGFRPFVHRLAVRHQVTGWVRNEAADVVITAQGEPDALDRFVHALRAEAPPLARIDELSTTAIAAPGCADFRIVGSDVASDGRQPVSPDVALCAACESELRDPANRRHRYAFITCTDCGPRHSVIDAMPYDRERTAMRAFAQCPACRAEYADIGDRRYHSETNSCPACGPRLRFFVPGALEHPVTSDEALAAAAAALSDGAIVAVRGIGGFHLAVDAHNEYAVERLRARKHRDGKPLAVLVRSLDEARTLAIVDSAAARCLESPERPIVILPRRDGAPVAASVSGPLDTIGLFLPGAPLHLLMVEEFGGPLVLTSGNRSHEPLAASLDEARAALGDTADAFLTHDREIVARTDDSVVRVVGGTPVILRRARGFAPLPVRMPVATPAPLLAAGAHLKNTLAVAAGRDVYVSQHLGDLETLETAAHWRRTADAFRALFRIEPAVVARDLHPDYLSTTLAEEMARASGLRVIPVQHHHAHVAAVAAEHGVTAPVVGIAFDGTGYGDDGAIWGGEFLVADLRSYRRAGHLRYVPLPGGDIAARTPWRCAAGWATMSADGARELACAFTGVSPREADVVMRQAVAHVNAPLTSSAGRLFDAAAAILGICSVARFEGEAAMRLESAADGAAGDVWPMPVRAQAGHLELDPLPLLITLAERRARGVATADLAAGFHESLAAGAAMLAGRIAEQEGVDTVVLGGGVFQNARFLVSLRTRLEAVGLRVLTARALPPNDGGLSYGQAVVAGSVLAAGA